MKRYILYSRDKITSGDPLPVLIKKNVYEVENSVRDEHDQEDNNDGSTDNSDDDNNDSDSILPKQKRHRKSSSSELKELLVDIHGEL